MIFLIFCLTFQVIANFSLELGQTYNDAIIPWQGDKNYKYYQIDIEKALQNRDLIIVVKQQSTLGNPDIYISSKEQKPNKTNYEIQCNSQGMDICVIEQPEKKTYYLAVYCEDYCRYNLKAVYQEELMMTNSDDLEFKFNSSSWTEIIRIKINQLNLNPIKQDQNLEVQVQVKNIEILQESFQSFMNFGMEKPTQQKHQYKGQDTFSGIQKFKINRIMANQTYTLLVEAQQGAIVQIKTRTYGQKRFINVGDSIEEVLQENEFGFYVLNITSDQEQFQLGKLILNIQLISFKGYTELYVNMDENPKSLEDYHWKLKDGSTDDLIITNEDLNRLKAKGFYAFIVIQAKESNATFELKTQMLNPDLMVMELNKPAISQMSKLKFHQYKFFIKSNKRQSVSVSLRNIKGDADIILKSCQDFWSCKFNQEEYNNINAIDLKNNSSEQQYLYSLNPGNDIIIFDYLPQNCKEYKNVHMCFYTIMIIPGQNNIEDELTYSILITTKQDSIILKENAPIKQFVFHEFYNYYKFIVNDNDHIKRLFIQLTPIQGQPKIFSSKSEIYPSKEQNDNQGVHNLITYGDKDNKESINGSIYIGVYGETASQYIITAIIFRKQDDWGTIGKYAHQYIQLIEGQPQEITTNYSQDIQLFKIDLTGYNDKETVKVYMRVNSGQFWMFGFDHPEVDINKAFLKGQNKLVLQLSNSQKLPQYLFVRVQTNSSTSYPPYSYSINYRVNSQPIELVIGDNYQGFIESSEKLPFFVNIYKEEDIYIFLHVENTDQSILSATIFVQDDIINMNSQSKIITANQLKYKKCKKTEEIVSCQITILIESNQDSHFSLLISKPSSIIKLYNEESITKTITNDYDYFTFLLTEETEIAIYSPTANIRILANIIQIDSPTIDQFPTNDDNSQFQSLNDLIEIESSLFISLDEIKKANCDHIVCYAAITCTLADPSNQMNQEYTIIRTSGAFKLFEGFVYQGKIKKDQIKYFKVTDVNEATGLQIIVTTSEKNQILLMASINQMPTQQSHDFTSSFNFGDYIIIPPKKDSFQIVTYYIGVLAYQEVSISIQVKMGLSRFYHIKIQKPFLTTLPEGSRTYLTFFNSILGDLSILISSNVLNQYLRPKILISTYQINQLSEVMNSIQTNYYWKMDDYYLQITSDQQNYCTNCYYMIYLENSYYEIQLTITINQQDSPIYLLDNVELKNQLKTNQSQRYIYYPRNMNDFYMNVTVFKGQIYLFDQKDGSDIEYSHHLLTLSEQDGLYDYLNNQLASREGIHANRSLYINHVKEKNNLSYYDFKVFSNFTNESIYQIEIIDIYQAIELKIGQPQKFKITSQNKVQLYFVIPEGTNDFNDNYYSITIEIHTYYKSQIYNFMPEFTLKQDRYNNLDLLSNYHDFVDAQLSILQELDNLIYIQIPSIPGLYFLTLNPKEINHFSYSITLGNKDYDILTPKSQRLVKAKVGEQKIWEIHLYQTSQLFVQIQLCGGIVNVFGSSSRDELSMGFFKDKIEHIQNKQLIGIIPSVIPHIYYLNTQTIKSTTQDDSVSYILRLDILQQDTNIPIDHFYPGDDGEFKILMISNELQFQFSPIQSSGKSSQDYSLESITYTFLYQKQKQNDNSTFDKCKPYTNYQSQHYKKIDHEAQKTLSQKIKIEEHDIEKLLATIQATVNVKTNNYERLSLTYYYKVKILESNTLSNDPLKGYFIIILAVLFFLFFILAMKYRNLRLIAKFDAYTQEPKQEYEQQIEMNYSNFK
ncbi:unnamed protein product [Paramecium sonneborni]|uniref:Transmembrane protein n=1 Tax=Paramecium sonneborni TaxID=65129 RepID=A0A8S1NUG0_9CILI|nr:unnamed protein product [Paramecium sonneborni]